MAVARSVETAAGMNSHGSIAAGVRPAAIEKRTWFGGLYQQVVIER